MKKNLFLILFFFFLAIFQASFLNHFSLWNITPNFVLIFLVLLNFFESSQKKSGLIMAAFGGILMDFFSALTFGAYFLTFIILALLIKKFLKFLGEENIAYFSLVFLISFVLCGLFSFVFDSILGFSLVFHFSFGKINIFEIAYNLLAALLIFLLLDYVRKYL